MTSCWEIVTSLSFFQFMANLEPSRSQIPDAWSVKLTFSLTITFYLTKTGNRTKKSLRQLSHCSFEYIFWNDIFPVSSITLTPAPPFRELHHILPKWTKQMNTKINSLFTSYTTSSLPHFFEMLDNPYSLNVLKSECSLMWDCS